MKQFFRPKHTLVFTSSTSTSTTTISRPFSSSSSSPASDSRSTICNPSTGALQLGRGKTRVANPSPRFHLPKTQLRTNRKQPKANQTLKRYLKSNSATKALLLFRDVLRKSPSTTDTYALLFVIIKACTQKSVSRESNCMPFLLDHIGFCLCRQPNEALQLFRQMQMHNVEPDQVTLTVALSACADLGALEMGEWIDAYVCHKHGFDTDLCLNNALVNMYAKCGDIGTARRLFDNIREKDVMTCTSMIVGACTTWTSRRSAYPFRKNERSKSFDGLQPREDDGGREAAFQKHEPRIRVETPRSSFWGLQMQWCGGLCSAHAASTETLNLARKLEPSYAGDDVTLSNIHAAKGMWDRKTIVRDRMKQRRSPGCSLIEVGRSISEFVSADVDHPLRTEIYQILRQLFASMKAYSYSPELSSLNGC
ncbi:hypothetical protein ACFX2K_039517 [Malus domestica]